MSHFFTENVARSYDEKNARLAPIGEALQFLVRLVLKDLPGRARVLCVGVGTGAEILSLAREYPEWSFVGVDPSAEMLAVCRERLEDAGIAERCTLIAGYVQDVPEDAPFDAALSILVGHFVRREDRAGFYEGMMRRLRRGGLLVNAEISFDMESAAFASMLANWGRVQTIMGATPESLQALPGMMRDVLCVLAPEETERLLQESGIACPVRFFQAFMVNGWYGAKA